MANKKDTVSKIEVIYTNQNGEVIVEQDTPTVYNSFSVKLQSLRDANISYTGQVTKRQYSWNGAGSIQAVDALDAPYLLEKQIKTQSCCGVNEARLFQQVD